jgi:hypothetical protein
MTIAHQIYEIVKTLPPEKANEVLTFAEFVRAKYQSSEQGGDVEDSTISWEELVQSLAGAWADDFPTLEEIRAGSGQDIPRESL